MEMLNAKKKSFSQLVARLHSFNVSDLDLIKELNISDPTLRNYKKDNKAKRKRISEPQMKLFILELSLSLVHKKGYKNPFEVIKKILIDGESFLNFLNKHATESLASIVVKQALELQVKNKSEIKPIDTYREKYTHLNNETLNVASKEDSELLSELINDTSLRPSTRADILEALALGGRQEYFEFIRSKVNETVPHIREAAFNGLFEYYIGNPNYSFLKQLFEKSLEKERADGVRQTISNLLVEMRAA